MTEIYTNCFARDDVQEMLQHWVSTPENGYLGSNFGYHAQLLAAVTKPFDDDIALSIEKKLKNDIPFFKDKNVNINWSMDLEAPEIFIQLKGDEPFIIQIPFHTQKTNQRE